MELKVLVLGTWVRLRLPLGFFTEKLTDYQPDRDGTMDLVITSCSTSDECSLSIAYNLQMPLCSKSHFGSNCRDPENLCVADRDFAFNLEAKDDNPVCQLHTSSFALRMLTLLIYLLMKDFTVIPIATLIPLATLVTESTKFRGVLPVSPSIGDYNIDGYPDLLLLVSINGNKIVHLLDNRPCDRFSCTEGQVEKGRRGFRIRTEGADDLMKITDAESASWVDIDDDVSVQVVSSLSPPSSVPPGDQKLTDIMFSAFVLCRVEIGVTRHYGSTIRVNRRRSLKIDSIHQKQLLS